MQFSKTADKVVHEEKSQTRRRIRQGEQLVSRDGKRTVLTASGRVKWQEGRTYPVQEGRNQPAIGRFRITTIRKQNVNNITDEEIKAEGFANRAEFMQVWRKLNGMNYLAWVIEFKLTEGRRYRIPGVSRVYDRRKIGGEYKWFCMCCHGVFEDHENAHECRRVLLEPYETEKRSNPDLLTKRQLSDAGFSVSAKLPPPDGAVSWSNLPTGYLWLYDKNSAIPKTPLTEKQQKAAQNQKRIDVVCPNCHNWLGRVRLNKCEKAIEDCFGCKARREAQERAQELLDGEFLILDSETTGLDGEAIELAIINQDEQVMFNRRLKPRLNIHPEAQRIHGMSAEMLATEPTFPDIYEELRALLLGRHVLIYNAGFDIGILKNMCRMYILGNFFTQGNLTVECVMELYSRYVADYNERYGDFRWQKLPGGDHSALGDCLATLRVLKEIAGVVE